MTQEDTIVDTLTQRGARYGKFTGHAYITQELLRVLFAHFSDIHKTDGVKLTDSQRESLHMICHKLARIVNGDPNYDDSWIDIAGYAKLIADELQGIQR